MLFAFDATPEDTKMTANDTTAVIKDKTAAIKDDVIQSIDELLLESREAKQADRCAKNLLDEVYGYTSLLGREIDRALDGLPKKGEMSPAARTVKEEFERNYETAGRLGATLGEDFKKYGVPLIRDALVEIEKDPALQTATVLTAGCAVVAAAAPNPWLKGAAMAGTVTGALFVVGVSATKRVDEFTEKLLESR